MQLGDEPHDVREGLVTRRPHALEGMRCTDVPPQGGQALVGRQRELADEGAEGAVKAGGDDPGSPKPLSKASRSAIVKTSPRAAPGLEAGYQTRSGIRRGRRRRPVAPFGACR